MRLFPLIALAACTADLQEMVALPGGDVAPTGVAADADGDLLLSSDQGLWKHEGGWHQLLTPEAIASVGFSSEVTDMAALPDGRIALTVPGIGLLYNPDDGSLIQHFCYEPGWGDWEISEQQTHTLAYDAELELLVSQPQTTTDGEIDRTDVADFDPLTGESLEWHTLDDRTFLATGLAARNGDLVLAQDRTLYDWRRGDAMPTERTRVAGKGPIQGLAWRGEELLVVDAEGIHVLK